MNLIKENNNNIDAKKEILSLKNRLNQDKNDVFALKKLCNYYKSTNNIELAIKYFSLLKAQTPFDKTIYYELGLLYYKKACYCKAIKNLMTAIKLDLDYTKAIYLLGEAHEAIEESEMAEMIYIKILEKNPNDIIACYHLADLYLQLNNYKKAINYYQEVIVNNPNSERAYWGIGYCLEKKGNLIAAKRLYKKYLELSTDMNLRKKVLSRLNEIRLPKNKSNKIPSYISLVK